MDNNFIAKVTIVAMERGRLEINLKMSWVISFLLQKNSQKIVDISTCLMSFRLVRQYEHLLNQVNEP